MSGGMTMRHWTISSLVAFGGVLVAISCAPQSVEEEDDDEVAEDAEAGVVEGACPFPGGWRTIAIGEQQRTYLVHAPADYDCKASVPLVLNFHGAPAVAMDQMFLSLMNAKADSANFIVVYPEGVNFTWNAGLCCGLSNDVAFAKAIVEDLKKVFPVDASRVFATGMSTGGMMANRLACDASDVFAAIASVAGPIMDQTCTPPRRVPMLHFHGTDDFVVPYHGSLIFPDVPTTITNWSKRNGCSTSTHGWGPGGEASCIAYDGCQGGGDVSFCTIANGGHTWPGGLPVPVLGHTTYDIDANDEMWSFFEAHPMP
jgi:polyhydroxybutyrate depolymerase